jgi:minor histocompatibility antigen H13
LTLAINAIELLNLGSFKIAATLLCGLFFYDIFWVFGTDVMVTVAKSFDAPIKVLFPKDFMVNGVHATELAMLGLGDIVLPGVLVALLWRFDIAHGRESTKPYFWCTYIAYLLGLVFTIVIMHTFKAAQVAHLHPHPLSVGCPHAC